MNLSELQSLMTGNWEDITGTKWMFGPTLFIHPEFSPKGLADYYDLVVNYSDGSGYRSGWGVFMINETITVQIGNGTFEFIKYDPTRKELTLRPSVGLDLVLSKR